MSDRNSPFYYEVEKRIKQRKQNCLILIVGDPGTGKSLLALRIAERLDPTFTHNNVRERVIVEPEQFAKILDEKGESRLEAGSVVIIDEAGAAALGARDWYSVGNKMISRILQTFRYRQIILIMTVPNMSFIDIHGRKLVNYLIETTKINFKERKTLARVWKLDFNTARGDGEPYRKRFRTRDEFGEIVILNRLWFDRAGIKLVHAYEKYANEFKEGIAQKAFMDLARVKEINNKKEFNVKEVAEQVLANIEKYTRKNGNIDKRMIEVDFGIGGQRSEQVKSLIRQLQIAKNNERDSNQFNIGLREPPKKIES